MSRITTSSKSACTGDCRGISFIDATRLKVCHNRRITGHRVFTNCRTAVSAE
ncbi:hypothetical protein H6F73_02475 [Microcoleus sp. FACHB-68]|nr:hypothetical protein [Microcoleus sp. FACHB-68]